MINKFLTTGFAFLLLSLTLSCTKAGDSATESGEIEIGTDAEAVGVIINKPRPPAMNIFPDFDVEIPETALGSELEDGDSSDEYQADTGTHSFGPLRVWTGIFLNGGITSVRSYRTRLEELGTEVVATLSEAGVTEITETAQNFTIAADFTLPSGTTSWEMEIAQEPGYEDYIRLYFRSSTSGLIEATYVAQTDGDANPKRGLFAYVNPERLSADAIGNVRITAMAFDFTDESKKLLVMRQEQYQPGLGRYYAFQIHQQCDETTSTCLGEYLEIVDEAPARQIEEMNSRFSWNEATNAVCLTDVDYSSGTFATLATYGFTGPDVPDEENVTENECSVATPHWGAHVFTANDLVLRYEDTDPHGGTALSYYVDGVSKSGWETLTPALIDTWLDASGF